MAVTDKTPAPRRDMHLARRQVGVNVLISILAAALLLVVVNVISNLRGWRRDMETLQRYSLSDSARRILDEVQQPVRVTTIYTSSKPDAKPEQYLPRLRDLLEEMRQHRPALTVMHANSDQQKAEILARLKKNLEQTHQKQRDFVLAFQTLADNQSAGYEQMAKQWAAYPAKGWLAQFGVPKSLEVSANSIKDQLRKGSAEFRQDMDSLSLPNYPTMAQSATGMLGQLEEWLTTSVQGARQIADLPGKAAKSRPEVDAAALAVLSAVNAFSTALQPPTTTAPADPAQTLWALVKAGDNLNAKARAAAELLDTLGAAGFSQATAWRTAQGELPALYDELAQVGEQLASEAQGLRQAAKPEVQRQVVQAYAQVIPKLVARAQLAKDACARLMSDVATVDEATAPILEQFRKADYLQPQLEAVQKLTAQAENLPKAAADQDITDRTLQQNVVVVEVGDKLGVLDFDEVWPLAPESMNDLTEEKNPRRVFYGDRAIASKILSLSQEPFGEVVLTYFEDWQGRPTPRPLFSMQLRTLRQQLERSNLKLIDWNLADPEKMLPPPQPGLPRVLLVLTPPEPETAMPARGQPAALSWGHQHAKLVQRQIDAGTPAVFLVGQVWPSYKLGQLQPYAYAFDAYLKDVWGVQARTGMRVVEGVRDATDPKAYDLPLPRLAFLPLSDFTDHAIGRSLKARKLYWSEVCPIVPTTPNASAAPTTAAASAPASEPGSAPASGPTSTPAPGKANVVVRSILDVTSPDAWGVEKPVELAQDLQRGSTIGPKPNDLRTPFSVAVESVRTVDGRSSRVVVLGVGFSYADEFLARPVRRLKANAAGASEPPPLGDVDLLTNSIYYLLDKGAYIGSGPGLSQPMILPEHNTGLQLACILAWPGAVLAIGAVIMSWRRRS